MHAYTYPIFLRADVDPVHWTGLSYYLLILQVTLQLSRILLISSIEELFIVDTYRFPQHTTAKSETSYVTEKSRTLSDCIYNDSRKLKKIMLGDQTWFNPFSRNPNQRKASESQVSWSRWIFGRSATPWSQSPGDYFFEVKLVWIRRTGIHCPWKCFTNVSNFTDT